MQEDYCIKFERSGGFMGQIIANDICSKDLSETDRRTLDSLILQSDILNYDPVDTLSPGFPDQFEYEVVIEAFNVKQSLKFNDSNLPDQIRPLINYLARVRQTGK